MRFEIQNQTTCIQKMDFSGKLLETAMEELCAASKVGDEEDRETIENAIECIHAAWNVLANGERYSVINLDEDTAAVCV